MHLLGVDTYVLNQDDVLGLGTKPVFIGVGTDGAAVNGAKNGLRGQMQRTSPWHFWCFNCTHRLELPFKAAFSSFLFESLQALTVLSV